MFEMYTERARRVVFFARYEASQFGSPYIETEHLLLGLLREDRTLTARFLGHDASVESIRKQIEGHTTLREKTSTSVDLPLSNECKRVLAYAAEEAERLSHKFVDTNHLLLGVLREEKCLAAEILHGRGLRLSAVRKETKETKQKQQKSREPRWPAFVAMGADALIHFALPERFSLGPRWILFAVIFALLVPIVFSFRIGRPDIVRILTFCAIGALTIALIGSLGLLIAGLPQHKDPPRTLLLSAVLLWITNILVFALWYWKLDAGGPLGREQPGARSSFLFPQMMRPPEERDAAWTLDFLDYLFLAFNTSTAFSPTDTAVLARWAKVMMMMQSMLSLAIIALLAARAVNVL
jgi:hypothetical protein